METPAIRPRRSARALIVSPERQILLMRIRIGDPQRDLWITPGGGLNDVETTEVALRRELYEETGHTHIQIGPLVWRRRHQFRFNGETVDQSEEFFWCPTRKFEPLVTYLEEGDERDSFQELRWWPIEEIGKSTDNFVPAMMYQELVQLFENGTPKTPLNVGI